MPLEFLCWPLTLLGLAVQILIRKMPRKIGWRGHQRVGLLLFVQKDNQCFKRKHSKNPSKIPVSKLTTKPGLCKDRELPENVLKLRVFDLSSVWRCQSPKSLRDLHYGGDSYCHCCRVSWGGGLMCGGGRWWGSCDHQSSRPLKCLKSLPRTHRLQVGTTPHSHPRCFW